MKRYFVAAAAATTLLVACGDDDACGMAYSSAPSVRVSPSPSYSRPSTPSYSRPSYQAPRTVYSYPKTDQYGYYNNGVWVYYAAYAAGYSC